MDDDAPGSQNENDPTLHDQPSALPASTPRAPTAPAKSGSVWRTSAVPIVAALLIGTGAGYALNDVTRSDGASAATRGLPAFRGQGGSSQSTPQGGRQYQGQGGGFGGVQGEERVQGTITAKTDASVTVKSSSGTASYAVGSTTQILDNGKSATLADVDVGDSVFLHVIPSSSGDKVVERMFVGTMPPRGPGYVPPGLGGGYGQGGDGQSDRGSQGGSSGTF